MSQYMLLEVMKAVMLQLYVMACKKILVYCETDKSNFSKLIFYIHILNAYKRFFYLAVLYAFQGLSSLTRDGTHTLGSEGMSPNH